MTDLIRRRIVDLEWPSRYLLECGHAVAIAADASAVDMAMPGEELPCDACNGVVQARPLLVSPFKAGEPINALTLNSRLREIADLLAARGLLADLTPFTANEPINAQTLNVRLAQITACLQHL